MLVFILKYIFKIRQFLYFCKVKNKKSVKVEDNKDLKSEIYSQRVKAGKRTYFFDIKSTKANDYYLTITESKKKLKEDGSGFFYEKHKIFLYKEDFNDFIQALASAKNYMKNELVPDFDFESKREEFDATTQSNSDLKWE